MAVTAMILAAGFGTRLAPLTDDVPKALVPVAGKPMLAHVIEAVQRAGCDRIVVNAHHHADQMRAYIASHDYGCEVILVEEDDILGTGGGILNARPYLEQAEHFLVHNVDIVTDFDLRALLDARAESGAFAALAVNVRTTRRALMFGEDMRFLGKEVWKDEGVAYPVTARRYGFCGIHAISSALFEYAVSQGFSDIFDVYRTAIQSGAHLTGTVFEGYWSDLGTVDRIREHEHTTRE